MEVMVAPEKGHPVRVPSLEVEDVEQSGKGLFLGYVLVLIGIEVVTEEQELSVGIVTDRRPPKVPSVHVGNNNQLVHPYPCFSFSGM